MIRFGIKAGLILALLGVAASIYRSDRILFERPEQRVDHYLDKLGERLRERHGIAFLMTFDEPGLREWISGARAIGAGVDAVPGRHGLGRRFSGTRWSFIQTPANWRDLQPAHTITLWIRLLPPSDQQDILFSFMQERHVGLRLEEGRLTFHIPAPGFTQTVSYPFTRWDEFVHIAAVADPETGIARLYENGRLMSEASIETVDFPSHNIEFGMRRWYVVRDPLHAELDETVIWNKVLTEKDIRRLHKTRAPVLEALEPGYHRRLRWTERLERGLKKAARYVDYFNPRLHHGRARGAAIPDINLFVRNRHVRHFNQAHYHGRQSGRRTAAGADFKRVEFLFDGKAANGELALDGSDTRYGASDRRAFILETGESPILGMRSLRLTPPEDAELLIPLFDARVAQHLGVPHVRNGLCRLFINGRFEGVYYYEDDTRRGVSPDAARVLMRGPGSSRDWPFLFRDTTPFHRIPRGPARQGVPLPRHTLDALFDELRADVEPLLINDVMSPLSSREIRYRLRQQREDLAQVWTPADTGTRAEQVAAYLTPFMVLGNNSSPDGLRDHLDLHALRLPDLTIAWSSSDPALVDTDGRVTRPAGDLPAGVTLTAHVSDGESTASRELSFRVMPRQPRLATYRLYFNEGLHKSRRVDCRIERYAPGTDEPQVFRAFQGERAGIKFRGNTSFWQNEFRHLEDFGMRKLAFSLRMDEPHFLLNDTRTRHLYFATGYTDTTLIRNKLSYDLFKAASEPDAPRLAPDTDWAEVFVNGHFQGLYEINTRVDRHLLGLDEEVDDPAALYKFVGLGNNFARFNPAGVIQKRPARSAGPHWEPYREMARRVGAARPDEFRNSIESIVDVGNVVDYHLLLNLTENVDGINVNLFLARDAGPEARFFIVPWDYDKTFAYRGGGRRHGWFSNALTARLMAQLPDHRTRLAERWFELRRERWSDRAIQARVKNMARHLDGYIQWDYRAWNFQYAGDTTFAEKVDQILERAHARAEHLDRLFQDMAVASDTSVIERPPEPESERETDL